MDDFFQWDYGGHEARGCCEGQTCSQGAQEGHRDGLSTAASRWAQLQAQPIQGYLLWKPFSVFRDNANPKSWGAPCFCWLPCTIPSCS